MIKRMKQVCSPVVMQGLTVLADQGGYSLTTLTCGLLLARSCSAAEYGIFVLGMSLVYMTKVIQRSLTTMPLSVFYPPLEAERKPSYLLHIMLLFWIVACGIIGVLFGVGYAVKSSSQIADLSRQIPWFIGVLVTMHFADFMRAALLAQFKTSRCFALGLLNHSLSMTGLLTLFIMNRLTVSTACLVLCVGAGVSGMLSGLIHVQPRYFRKDLFVKDCFDSLRYGGWILGGTLVNILGLSLLPWITLLWWDSQTVAAIGALTLAASMIRPCQEAMVHYLTPVLSDRLASRGRLYAKDRVFVLLRTITVLGFISLVAVAILGPWILFVLYGRRYEGYSESLFFFTASVMFRVLTVPIRSYMIAEGAAQTVTHNNIMASFVAIALSFVLIPQMGVMGVALIHLVFNLILFGAGYFYVFGRDNRTLLPV
jgi:O-antigen/teichoic acid export membrane protein